MIQPWLRTTERLDRARPHGHRGTPARMRHAAAGAIVLGLTGCPAGKPAQTTPAAALAPQEVVSAAKGVIEQWRQAYEVRRFEALAKLSREGSVGVTTVSEIGARTLVLRRGADGWQIVQEHYSYKRPS